MQGECYSEYVGLSGVYTPISLNYLLSEKFSELLGSPLPLIHCVPGFCAGVKESVRETTHLLPIPR
jgi:hypothetical protein